MKLNEKKIQIIDVRNIAENKTLRIESAKNVFN